NENAVAVADALQRVPLTNRLLRVVLTTESFFILPDLVAPQSVEQARGSDRRLGGAGHVKESLESSIALKHIDQLGFERNRCLGASGAEGHQVARASFRDPAPDRLHPEAERGPFFARRMQQDA